MATLTVIYTMTYEEFKLEDINLEMITPRDILSQDGVGQFLPPGEFVLRTLKGSVILDELYSLDSLGFKDGDKAYIFPKVYA